MTRTLKLAALALLAILGLVPASGFAATQDYRFELVNQTLKMGHDVPINVRLVNTTTSKPVADATITKQKLNMLMGSMAMPGQVKASAPDANGTYHFTADMTMAGSWQLDLMAQVPDEKDPVQGALKFQVEK